MILVRNFFVLVLGLVVLVAATVGTIELQNYRMAKAAGAKAGKEIAEAIKGAP